MPIGPASALVLAAGEGSRMVTTRPKVLAELAGKTILQWSVDAFLKWYGIARKPHYGTILAAARDGDPEARDALIRLAGDPLFPTLVRATALSLLDRGETYAHRPVALDERLGVV